MGDKCAFTRNCWQNYEKAQYTGQGVFDIPIIKGTNRTVIPQLIDFSQVLRCKAPSENGVHFFLYDYQFSRVWDFPERWMNKLKEFQCVCSPDFSIYTDFPKALQIYAHYKKHWLAAYWEENGIEVIPSINWGDESSYNWCFDGEPIGGTIAITSQGTQNRSSTKKLFLKGYDAMLERLQPETIIFYGNVPSKCRGNIVHIKNFCELFRIARMEVMK